MVPGTTVRRRSWPQSSRGLYVTDLIGFGINGDRRLLPWRERFGLRMGNWPIRLKRSRSPGNLKQMYATIETIGSDLVFSWTDRQPTVKIAEMMVAGN